MNDKNSQEQQEIRSGITRVDGQLLKLLSERKNLTLQMGKFKDKSGSALRDQDREKALLEKLTEQGKPLGLDQYFITNLYHVIFEDSIRGQERYLTAAANTPTDAQEIRVTFEGNTGSYSYIAATQHFPESSYRLLHIPSGSFKEAIASVEGGNADIVILPIENTTSGGINEVYDQLLHTSLSIIGEELVTVDHCLLGNPNTNASDIRTVYAHPQGIAQCNHFLAGLKDCEFVYVETSEAIQRIIDGDDSTSAAIAGRQAAKRHGLEIVEPDIANQAGNFTRFLVASRKSRKVPLQVSSKVSLVVSTAQHPGSLVEALMLFKERDINMVKLESRPIMGNPWEEMFYIDAEANLQDPKFQDLLEELGKATRFLKVLGCYPTRGLSKTKLKPKKEDA